MMSLTFSSPPFPSALLSSEELARRIRRLRKDHVKDLYDAARDVARGSSTAFLPEMAQRVLQVIETWHPDWIA